MTADQIHEYANQHIERGTLKHELASFRMLAEIAAQLAEMNERAEDPTAREHRAILGTALRDATERIDRLIRAGDALAEQLGDITVELESSLVFPSAKTVIDYWKAARK